VTLLVLDRTALGAVLLTPLLLLHAHGFAEAAVAVVDVCFLARSVITRDWRWLRTPWLTVGMAWWGWVLFCSLPLPLPGFDAGGMPALVQGLVNLRFLILLAAMEHAVLRAPEARRWLFWIVTASAVYVALQALIQFVVGYNLYGDRVGPDRELTGPFGKPRAGPPLSRVILPAIIPPVAGLLERRRATATLLALALLAVGVCVMVLIGQRMPLLLTGLGLLVAALLIRRLRPAVVAAAVAAALLLAASPVVAPAAYHRLVQEFTRQMQHFATSQYGLLYTRAWEIGVQQGITGLGADGFRYGCEMPQYFRPSFDGSLPDGGGATPCWHHPHNIYFEALASGGFLGLALFCTLAVAWLAALGRGLRRRPEPLRVALFAAAFIQLWPIASASGFTSMPMGGWFFLLLGWGLAEARAATTG
jgi:O-antigen ligase